MPRPKSPSSSQWDPGGSWARDGSVSGGPAPESFTGPAAGPGGDPSGGGGPPGSFSPASESSVLARGSLTLCTMNRWRWSAGGDVKHSPQCRHCGLCSSVLCWGMCCWKRAASSVVKPHLEQRYWALGRLAEETSGSSVGSSWLASWAPAAGLLEREPCRAKASRQVSICRHCDLMSL